MQMNVSAPAAREEPDTVQRRRPIRTGIGGALLWIAFLLSAGGCGRVQAQAVAINADVVMSLTTVPDPPVVGQGLLTVTLADTAGRPVDGALVAVEANMTHAGIGARDGRGPAYKGGVL